MATGLAITNVLQKTLIMRELNCCGVIIPERTKTAFVEILLELSTI